MRPKEVCEANCPLATDLLQEAVRYLEDSFENSEEVNGAALVEWFSEWRIRAGQALRTHEARKLS